MIQSFKKRLMFEIAIALVAIAVIVVALVYLGKDISEKSNLIYKIRSDSSANVKAVSDLAKLKESSKGTDVMLEKLNGALPTENDIFLITRDIGDLAKQYNLGFGQPKFVGNQIAASELEPGRVKLEMTAQGSYTGIVRFIKDLETGRFFVKLTGFDIFRQGLVYSAVISGELYFK